MNNKMALPNSVDNSILIPGGMSPAGTLTRNQVRLDNLPTTGMMAGSIPMQSYRSPTGDEYRSSNNSYRDYRSSDGIQTYPVHHSDKNKEESAYERLISNLEQELYAFTLLGQSDRIEYGNDDDLGWKSRHAINRYYQIQRALGRKADAIDRSEGGIAWWKNPRGKVSGEYFAFKVCDPRTRALKPSLYDDHFLVEFKMCLKAHVAEKLHEFAHCAHYNANHGIIYISSHCLGGAILELAIIKMVNHDHITCHEAKKYHMMWTKVIADEWKSAHKEDDIYSARTPLTDSLEKYIMS